MGVVEEAKLKDLCKGSDFPLTLCLEECRSSLTSWNSNTFRHVGKKIGSL